MNWCRAILPLLAAIVTVPAPAQTPPVLGDAAKAMLGDWEFSNAARDKVCTATFKRDAVKVGFKVAFDANCASLFPQVEKIAGWRFPDGDNLFLLDADGQPLAEFSEVESGIFEAPTPGVGVLFLQAPGAAAGPAQKTPQDMAGTWAVTRGGATVCALTLAPSTSADGFALTLSPGCGAALNFTHWRLDGSELLLMPATGTPWRFVEVEGGSWQRLAGGSNQIMLVRQ
jgi:hypothetical protein